MVNTHLSDLFFNHDLTRAWCNKRLRYNHDIVLCIAEEFLGMLRGMGFQNLPSTDVLVDDFFRRL